MKRQTVTDTQAAAFIAACLAPLPADSEPAETKEFLAQLKRARIDSKKAAEEAWYVGSMRIQAALHAREALTYARLYKQALGGFGRTPPSSRNSMPADSRAALIKAAVAKIGTVRSASKWTIAPLLTPLSFASWSWVMRTRPRAALHCAGVMLMSAKMADLGKKHNDDLYDCDFSFNHAIYGGPAGSYHPSDRP